MTIEKQEFKASIKPLYQPETSNATSERLFIGMCSCGVMVDDPGSLGKLTGLATKQINYYRLEAALYVARISVYDLSAPKAKRPVFHLKMDHFSPELQYHLRNSVESLNDIITSAAFELFRARHTLAFYRYIEPKPKEFKWSLT